MISEKQFLEMAERERDAWLKDTFGLEDGKIYNKGLSYEPLRVPLDHTRAHVMEQVFDKMRDDGWTITMVMTSSYGNLCVMSMDDAVVTGLSHIKYLAVYLAAGRAIGKIE